jgi:hypothetical protein
MGKGGNAVKLKTLLTVTTVISLLNGFSYLFTPSLTMTSIGLATNVAAELMARYFGASTIGISVLSWMGRGLIETSARRSIVTTLFVSFVLYMIVDLIGLLTGVMNLLGLTFVVADFVLGLGYGYFLFARPGSPD